MENPSVKILRASAGSGKTYRLAYEYIKRVVRDPYSYRSILAVTFTNKATQEMKSRIVESLNALAGYRAGGERVDYLDDLTASLDVSWQEVVKRASVAKQLILHDYSNFAVSTIDKFFQRITRSFFKELGFDFGYEVELSSEHFMIKAVANLIERSVDDMELGALLQRVVDRELETNKCNIHQRLMVIGDTLVKGNYVHSADDKSSAELALSMDDILAMRDTLEADLRDKCSLWIDILVNQCGVEVVDMHYGNTGFAGFIEKIAKGGEIKPSSARVLNAVGMSLTNWLSKKAQKQGLVISDSRLEDLLKDIVDHNDRYQKFNNSCTIVNKHFDSRLVIDYLSLELDRLLGENNRLPIHRTTTLVSDIAEHTEVPFIYEKLGTTYSTYMIDEFQDTSTSQWQGFLPLLYEAVSHTDGESVLLIGDVKQAIYRWRGGDWNILGSQAVQNFRSYQVDDFEHLDTNWRSLPQIVDFNNDLLSSVIQTASVEIGSIIKGDERFAHYESMLRDAYSSCHQSARKGATGGYVEVNFTDDPLEQTVNAISKLMDEYNYQQRDIAVLVRSNREGEQIASHLITLGYNVVSDEALKISTSSTVRFVINVIKLSLGISVPNALAEYNFYRKHTVNQPLSPEEDTYIASLSLQSSISVLESVISHYDLRDSDTSYLQALYESVYRYSVNTSGDLARFIEWWDETGKNQSLSLPKGQDAITIISIHKSKGLQYPSVIIPWCSWNLLPLSCSKLWVNTPDEPFCNLGNTLVEYTRALGDSCYSADYVRESVYSYIDNINMLYVAVTRAEESLFIFAPNPASESSKIVHVGDLVRQFTQGQSFGTLSRLTRSAENYSSMVFDHFESWDPSQRISTLMPHHVASSDLASLDNRHYGVLMHDILSNISTLDDIAEAVRCRVELGKIGEGESSVLISQLMAAVNFSDQIRDWFSDRWEVVNERGIILPSSNTIRRPDRVLVGSGRVLVIDYKFGLVSPKHISQVREYASLLRSMGYQGVECYLWYVTSNEVVDCTNL